MANSQVRKMRRVDVLTISFLWLCAAAFCRVASFDASWNENIKDDHENSPYSEYQKTLWYRKPRYSESTARNYGNLGLAGSSASRIQDYGQIRSIDPYSLNLGYTRYNRPARSRDTSYVYSPESSALEDDPYGNLNSFSGRALREMDHYASMDPSTTGSNARKLHDENPYGESRIDRSYEMDTIEDPYTKDYEIQEQYKIQPQTRERKLYVVPRGDQKKSDLYLRDADAYERIPRMNNFKADKELENAVKRAITLLKLQNVQEADNERNFKVSDVLNSYEKMDQVPPTGRFRNSDIIYRPEVKENPYSRPIDLHDLELSSGNIGKGDLNFEELGKIDKVNDDDFNLAEMERMSKANQERDFILADDVAFGEIQKREYPDEVLVDDNDNTQDDEDVVEDLPNVAFGEDFAPVRQEIRLVESNEDFNGRLGEDANDDILEGDVVLGDAVEEDEPEGAIGRSSSETAEDAQLKNDDMKLIENSSIAEIRVKGNEELTNEN